MDLLLKNFEEINTIINNENVKLNRELKKENEKLLKIYNERMNN